jgi:hypothetical protein
MKLIVQNLNAWRWRGPIEAVSIAAALPAREKVGPERAVEQAKPRISLLPRRSLSF